MRLSNVFGRLSRHRLLLALVILVAGAGAGALADITLTDSNGVVKTICSDEVAGRNYYCFKIFDAATGSANGASVNANHELLVKQTDAVTANTELTTPTALADATANPTLPFVAGFMMRYNGSTWDRWTGQITAPTPSATSGYFVVRCTDGTIYVDCGGSGGSGGTSSNFGSAFPTPGTAAGFSDGTNMRGGHAYDLDSTGGTEYAQGVNLRIGQAGASIEAKGQQVMASSIPVVLPSDQTVGTGGNVAHDGADSGNPVKIGCRARTSDITAVANNDRSDVECDTLGNVITRATRPDTLVRGCNNSTGTGDTLLIAAPGAGSRVYVTRVTAFNVHATTGTYISVKTASSVMDEIPTPANFGGAVVQYGDAPLRGGDNEAINFASFAGVTTIRVCASGYVAAN